MESKYKSYSKKKSNSLQSINTTNNYYLLPLIIIASVLPFITRLHYYNPRLSQYIWFWNIDSHSDFFLYYKQIILILIAAIMLITLVYLTLKGKIMFKLAPALWPLLIYAVCSFLSTIFSKYSSFGFTGIYEQFESVFALLSYCIIVFYCFYFIKSEKNLECFIKYFLISIIVFALLGVTQSFGYDILRTDFGKKLYIGSNYWSSLDQYQFIFPPKTSYLTMYNPNYAGVYTALIIPVIIVLLITCRNIKKIIVYSICLIGMLITLYGTGSAAGEIAVACCLILVVLLFRKTIFKRQKLALSISGVFITVIIGIGIIKFDTLQSTIVNFLSFNQTHYALTNIKTEDSLTLTYNNNDLVIKSYLDSGSLYFNLSDQNNTSVPYNMDTSTGKVTIQDTRFQSIIITPAKFQETLCLDVNIDGKDWYFTNQLGDNTYYYLNPMYRFDKIKNADSSLFTGYENIASGRGYIWSRTIPLLKNSLLLGTGADSFVFDFPHQDYLYNNQAGFEGSLLTKPHSLYLQIGVQTGVVSLLAFLAFYGIYFVNCIRLFWKSKFESCYEKVGTALFVGSVSYMITGLANDSSITVAPVFWVLIGIGTAINHILLTNKKHLIAQ